MARAQESETLARSSETRKRWLLSMPALVLIGCSALGPLLVVLAYSFMAKGDYGGVKFGQFSTDGWFAVFFNRDIFDDTVTFADAHLSILWRS